MEGGEEEKGTVHGLVSCEPATITVVWTLRWNRKRFVKRIPGRLIFYSIFDKEIYGTNYLHLPHSGKYML